MKKILASIIAINLIGCATTKTTEYQSPVGVETADIIFRAPQGSSNVIRIYAFDEKTCAPHSQGYYIGGMIQPRDIPAKIEVGKPFTFDLVNQYSRSEFLTPGNHCSNSGVFIPEANTSYILTHTLNKDRSCQIEAIATNSQGTRAIELQETICKIKQF